MYFIVYIHSIKQHRVVPTKWMREFDLHTEKFMNYGVNSNQSFLVFWTDDLSAFDIDGIPHLNVIANEAAAIRDDFPHEGWYKCRIVKFKVDREQALRYVQLRRNYAPGLYNNRRLSEKPIPTTTQNVQHTIHPSQASTSNQSRNSSAVVQNASLANKENVSPNVGLVDKEAGPSNQSIEFVDVNASRTASPNVSPDEPNPILIAVTTTEKSPNDMHTESTSNLDDDLVDVHTENPTETDSMYNFSIDETQSFDLDDEQKPNAMPVLDFQSENFDEISNVLTATKPATPRTEVIDHECEMTILGTFPQPQHATIDELIKRANDDISMNEPFTETKTGRIYKVGNMLIEISYRVIDRLREWNEDRANNNFDRLYVLALLLVLVSKDDIRRSNIDQNVIAFIRQLMWVRALDESRVAAVDKYIEEYCNEKSVERSGETSHQ